MLTLSAGDLEDPTESRSILRDLKENDESIADESIAESSHREEGENKRNSRPEHLTRSAEMLRD